MEIGGRVENLRFFTSEQDREAASRNGRKGGIASGKARRARREAREEAEARRRWRAWHPWIECLEKSAYGLLTYKQKRFLDYYILHGNADKAARLAGYKGRSAPWRLFHDRKFLAGWQAYIKYGILHECGRP